MQRYGSSQASCKFKVFISFETSITLKIQDQYFTDKLLTLWEIGFFVVFEKAVVDFIWFIEFSVQYILSSCNHTKAKEIKGHPPGFVPWLCKRQLYLAQEISLRLPFWANCHRIVRRGRAEEQLLSICLLLATQWGQCWRGKVIHRPYAWSQLQYGHSLVLGKK